MFYLAINGRTLQVTLITSPSMILMTSGPVDLIEDPHRRAIHRRARNHPSSESILMGGFFVARALAKSMEN